MYLMGLPLTRVNCSINMPVMNGWNDYDKLECCSGTGTKETLVKSRGQIMSTDCRIGAVKIHKAVEQFICFLSSLRDRSLLVGIVIRRVYTCTPPAERQINYLYAFGSQVLSCIRSIIILFLCCAVWNIWRSSFEERNAFCEITFIAYGLSGDW